MKEKSQISSGIILSYVYLTISMIAGLLYTPIMLELMGQSEYGLYSLASSIISYLSFLGLGLESALVKYTARYAAQKDKEAEARLGGMYLVIYSVIAVIVMVCGMALSQNVELLSKTLTTTELGKLRIMILILAGNLAVSFPMSVFGSAITAHEKFTFRKVVSIIREILLPFTILFFLSKGYRAIGLVVIHTVFNVFVLISDFVYATRKLHYRPRFAGFDRALFKEIFQYTIWVFIGTIVDRISNATNSTVLAATSGTAAVAVFNIGALLYSYYLNFSSSIAGFFFPRVVGISLKENGTRELSDLFIKVGRIQLYVVALICSGFLVFGRDFIRLWSGVEYWQAYWIAAICMVPTMINRSQSLGPQILLAQNKHKFRALVFLAITIADVLLSIPLAIRYEGIGAAIGTAIATIMGPILIMNVYYHKVMGLDIGAYWRNCIPLLAKVALLLAMGMLMNRFWPVKGWAALIVQIMIYSAAYLYGMYRFSFNAYEKSLFSSIARKLWRRGE